MSLSNVNSSPSLLKREVILVAEPGDDSLPGLAVVIAAQDLAAGRHDPGRMAAGIVEVRQQLALVRHVHRAGRVDRRLQVSMIAVVVVKRPVGPQGNRVRPVLAHPAPGRADQLALIEVAVVVGIAQPVDARTLGTIADREQPARG